MNIQIGIGDIFTYNKEKWTINNIKGDDFICKNKRGEISTFKKELVKKYFK